MLPRYQISRCCPKPYFITSGIHLDLGLPTASVHGGVSVWCIAIGYKSKCVSMQDVRSRTVLTLVMSRSGLGELAHTYHDKRFSLTS
jgi:hypothetical protein